MNTDESDVDFWGRASPSRRTEVAALHGHDTQDDDGSSEEDDDDDDDGDEIMSDEDEVDDGDRMEIFGHR